MTTREMRVGDVFEVEPGWGTAFKTETGEGIAKETVNVLVLSKQELTRFRSGSFFRARVVLSSDGRTLFHYEACEEAVPLRTTRIRRIA